MSSDNNTECSLRMCFFVFLCVTCCVWPTESTCTNIEKPKEISIDINPHDVYPGLTRDMTLSCSFSPQQYSDFDLLNSLIVSKIGSDDKYSELAAMTSHLPHAITKTSLGAEVTGRILTNGTSYITFTWVYPTNDVMGQYRCEVHGMDCFGRPVKAVTSAIVTERPVEYSDLLEKMKTLETTLNDHMTALQNHKVQLIEKQDQLDNQTSQIMDLKSKLETQNNELKNAKDDLSDKQKQLDEQQRTLNELLVASTNSHWENTWSGIMEDSDTYNGHRYYLSRQMSTTEPERLIMCKLLGGYLVEFEDQSEYDFITKFLRDRINHIYINNVYIGGTDEGQEGQWWYRRSGKAMTFFSWGSGQPSNEGNCLEIYHGYDYNMDDIRCYYSTMMRFICEVPS